MIYTFLDTNIYLNFYRFSNEDLKKLESLIILIEKTGDINLFITEQVKNEFYRNRESVINEILNRIESIGSGGLNLPSFSKEYSEHLNLQKSYKKLIEEKQNLKDNILKDFFDFNLPPDLIIGKLFELSKEIKYSNSIFEASEKRSFIGNPPGKKLSNGDIINWESLLESFPNGEDIYFVGGDGDFKSSINNKEFNKFLLDEWKSKKESNIHFYENISIFLKDNFPNLEELDDYIKNKKIEELKNSSNFNYSRQILRDLLAMGSFNDEQLQKILEYSYGNNQVSGAHRYSPSQIGGIINELMKDKHRLIPPSVYDNFCKTFGIKKEVFYFQYENGERGEIPF